MKTALFIALAALSIAGRIEVAHAAGGANGFEVKPVEAPKKGTEVKPADKAKIDPATGKPYVAPGRPAQQGVEIKGRNGLAIDAPKEAAKPADKAAEKGNKQSAAELAKQARDLRGTFSGSARAAMNESTKAEDAARAAKARTALSSKALADVSAELRQDAAEAIARRQKSEKVFDEIDKGQRNRPELRNLNKLTLEGYALLPKDMPEKGWSDAEILVNSGERTALNNLQHLLDSVTSHAAQWPDGSARSNVETVIKDTVEFKKQGYSAGKAYRAALGKLIEAKRAARKETKKLTPEELDKEIEKMIEEIFKNCPDLL